MRMLITGHTGYIGSVLTELLPDVGMEVARIDSGFFKDCLLDPPRRECPTSPKTSAPSPLRCSKGYKKQDLSKGDLKTKHRQMFRLKELLAEGAIDEELRWVL